MAWSHRNSHILQFIEIDNQNYLDYLENVFKKVREEQKKSRKTLKDHLSYRIKSFNSDKSRAVSYFKKLKEIKNFNGKFKEEHEEVKEATNKKYFIKI